MLSPLKQAERIRFSVPLTGVSNVSGFYFYLFIFIFYIKHCSGCGFMSVRLTGVFGLLKIG